MAAPIEVNLGDGTGALIDTVTIDPAGAAMGVVVATPGLVAFPFQYYRVIELGAPPTPTIDGCQGGIATVTWTTPSAPDPTQCHFACGAAPTSLALGDFNGDGATDLAWIDASDPNQLDYTLELNQGSAVRAARLRSPPISVNQ